jgi:hypothetical protein
VRLLAVQPLTRLPSLLAIAPTFVDTICPKPCVEYVNVALNCTTEHGALIARRVLWFVTHSV